MILQNCVFVLGDIQNPVYECSRGYHNSIVKLETDILYFCIRFKSIAVKRGRITFNNSSAISWWSVSLVEETGVPGENHQSAASH